MALKTTVTVERLHESGPDKRPITVRVLRGNRSMVAFMTDEEALEVAGAIRDAVRATGKTREVFEVEKEKCMCNGDTVLVCRTCAESQ